MQVLKPAQEGKLYLDGWAGEQKTANEEQLNSWAQNVMNLNSYIPNKSYHYLGTEFLGTSLFSSYTQAYTSVQ